MNRVPAPHTATHLITGLRGDPGVLRTVAVLVTLTFVMLILAPTAAAARAEITEAQARARQAPTEEARFAKVLQEIEQWVERAEQTPAALRETNRETQDLAGLRRQLKGLDRQVRTRFKRLGQELEAKGLPAVILQRHREAVAQYQSRYAEFEALAEELQDPATGRVRPARLQALKAFFQTNRTQRTHQPFDPDDLRDHTAPDPTNVPRLHKADYRSAGLHDRPKVQLAANADFRLDGLPGAEDPAFLAETPEVQLTAAIRAKAAELNHDPVAIYHWVRNHIEWLPTWGARQDAELTLSARRGNAMEIAGLTIALLRASDLPARYVHGVIEVPADAFTNWVGDFADVAAAQEYAARGGIPTTSVVAGGTVTKMRLEHIWVEVAADYDPSRGAVNRAADRWVRLDPSFKQYAHRHGLDVLAISGLDPSALADSFLASGTLNAPQGWSRGLMRAACRAPRRRPHKRSRPTSPST